jgi:hypothetical protein
MRASIRTLSVLLAVIGGSECDAGHSTSPGIQMLTTDATSYTAVPIGNGQLGVSVVTRFQNTTLRPIALDRCSNLAHSPEYGVSLVSPQSNEGAGYDPGWACLGGVAPIMVGPGDTRIDTLTLRGPNTYDNQLGRFLGVMAGTFRVSFGGHASNEFDITPSPDGIVPAVPRDTSAAILTDSQLVHLRLQSLAYSAVPPIHVTIFNPRSDTSFIVNCDGSTGLSLEKQDGTQWVPAWSAVVLLCLSPPIVIPPKGQYGTSIDFIAAAQGTNILPQFFVKDIPGVYRLVWSQIVDSFSFSQAKWGAPIPVEYRRSNAFAIVVDP